MKRFPHGEVWSCDFQAKAGVADMIEQAVGADAACEESNWISVQCHSSILAKSKWRDAKSGAKGAGLVIQNPFSSRWRSSRTARHDPTGAVVCAHLAKRLSSTCARLNCRRATAARLAICSDAGSCVTSPAQRLPVSPSSFQSRSP